MTRTTRFKLLPLALLLAAAPMLAGAEDLMDAYRDARANDPQLAQADAARMFNNEFPKQAWGALLPQINASYGFTDSHGSSTSAQPFIDSNGALQVQSFRSSTSGRNTTLQGELTQTLFDWSKFAQVKVGKAQAAGGEAQYQAALQSLMLRTAQAYFNVLTAIDTLTFAQAEEKALARQLEQAQQRFEVGLSAITDVNEAKAQHDSAVANVIDAQNALDDAREALTQITGKPAGELKRLREDLPLNPPQPNNLTEWVDTALKQNPALLAQQFQVEADQHSVNVARSAHLPTLNASVVYTRTPSWSDQTFGGLTSHINSERSDTAVGLVLSVPIFSGGITQSRVRQAIYQRDQASDLLEQDRRQVVRNTRNAFRSVIAGVSEVEARKQAVISAQSALDATRAGFEVGTRTIVDVLISQQNLFQAQSNYSQARHAFVINQLALKQSAGTIDVKDIEAVNALLQ
ncbi:type I secretion outer membrane protein, TolC family [Mizugakiibacter sediminis]|uniref:Type I secretion outer membrane protein, TolC family n=1 Tax=Mizugakiibacter sediminis TaxID=1475481 RepID=A0A0K8QQ71_9GAMM|nr:TolC family outer membrane protein [Mizugakiibacter sediminis]GAP66557.1 type I secretion outer membrane protein, TolC family [Mizugakiibacter sediminis]